MRGNQASGWRFGVSDRRGAHHCYGGEGITSVGDAARLLGHACDHALRLARLSHSGPVAGTVRYRKPTTLFWWW